MPQLGSNGARRLRVGSVPYLVGRPADLGLGDEPGIDFSTAVPAALVRGLREGTIDVALVSSIELFRREGYGYLAGPAVCGKGHVGSVQLFLRRPVEELRTVALDPASRTAAALVQVELAGRAARPVEFRTVEPGVDPRSVEADGWLRIGDAALREALATDAPPTFNPSASWAARTGLPFVFAPWIVAPGVDPAPWAGAFARARRRGAEATGALAAEAARAWRVDGAAALHYLAEECWYDPAGALTPALLAWRDAAAALGLCRADLEPRAIPLGD